MSWLFTRFCFHLSSPTDDRPCCSVVFSVESGEKYKTGSNTFNFLPDALYRSCDEQRNNCYDFANSQYGQTSVSTHTAWGRMGWTCSLIID